MEVNQKIKYQKSRYIVKKWESDFKNTKGKAPTKLDIKTAPKRVKDAYSTYWKLKANLLETLLIDATFDENAKDCFTTAPVQDSPPIKPSPSQLLTSPSDLTVSITSPNCPAKESAETHQSPLPISFKSLINSAEKKPLLERNNDSNKPDEKTEKKIDTKKSLGTLTENTKDKKSEDSVWGPHLSLNRPQTGVRSLKERSVSFQYTEKLFANAKFSKRNPRKTLRRNKTCDVIPGCENSSTLGQSSQLDTSTSDLPPTEHTLPSQAPLEFAAPSPVLPFSPCSGFSEEGGNGHFDLLSEVKRVVIKEAPRVVYQGTSVVQALLRGNGADKAQGSHRIVRSLDPGWLGRIDSDSGIASSSGPPDDGSDDELICSDEESKSRFTLTVSNCAKRRSDPSSGCEPGMSSEGGSTTVEALSDPKPAPLLAVALSATLSSNLSPDVAPKKPAIETAQALSSNTPRGVALKKPSVEAVRQNSVFDRINFDERPFGEEKIQAPLKRIQSDPPSQPAKRIKLDSTPAMAANKKVTAKKQATLEKKVTSGDANKNFRRIDITKKVFTRGKKSMNFSKYKKKQWKELKGMDSSGVIKCFKCGDVGHMARQCKGVGDLLPYEEYEEESIFPSLEEAAEAATKQAEGISVRKIPALKQAQPKQNTEVTEGDDVELDAPIDEQNTLGGNTEPLYSLQSDGISTPEADEEVLSVLKELGHSSFLPGQEEAVMSVLCGKSCLVVMPTGSGKSLIYRLPALLYHRRREGAIALVVSPLVSLMEDQVLSSESVSVGCLHHCQTEKQRKLTEEQLSDKQLSVLLVSPELLTSDSAMSLLSKLPSISFACIDEAHCLSHWSHNFRPSYLSLCQLLRERLGVTTLLGLTASVTAGTVESVLTALGGVDKVRLVKSQRFVPENLVLSVSQDADRDGALLTLLEASRFASCNSVIVYCTRREECVRVAALLRTNMQSQHAGGKSRLSQVAEVYHAGLTPSRRKQVQNAFMSGKTRIVVATVAFGMGINKRDLRGVIHYNMPSSLENYLQEVGRAGRDGLPAHCHLFLSPNLASDMSELKRHIYANSVDRCSLRHLLDFARPECTGCTRGKHEVAFPVDNAVQELDITQEVISTLIAYLATSGLGFSLLPHAYTRARASSYKGPAHLASLAKQCGVLGVGVAMARKVGKVTNSAEFDVIKVADSIGWDSGIVKRTLKNLEWTKTEDTGKWSKSGLNVELCNLGFRLVAPCGLTADQQDAALDLLHDRTVSHETIALKQLQFLHDSLQTVAYKSVRECCDDIDIVRCEKLASSIHLYFTSATALDTVQTQAKPIECESEVESTVRSLVSSGGSREEWTGRAVARILHGISSPCYPALVWYSTPFWRRHLDQDFPSLLSFASLCLRRLR